MKKPITVRVNTAVWAQIKMDALKAGKTLEQFFNEQLEILVRARTN